MVLDWRGAAARELHHSECLYLGKLSAVLKVYFSFVCFFICKCQTLTISGKTIFLQN